MKRLLISILIYMCIATALARAADSPVPGHTSSHAQVVVTAMDHLTVLEYEEPVVQAAAGSSAFQIERQDNKVFIKPMKAGATTNLFIWTASHQSFSYELSVGDLAGMNAEIHVAVPKTTNTAAASDTSLQMEQVADMLITRTLLGAESIDSSAIKAPRKQVGLRIQQVFRSRTSLYIQYSIENLSGLSYRLTNPTLYEVQVNDSQVKLPHFRGKQVDQQVISGFGRRTLIPLTIAHADSEAQDIAPGERKQGIVSIRRSQDSSSPLVVRLAFGQDVSATVVF